MSEINDLLLEPQNIGRALVIDQSNYVAPAESVPVRTVRDLIYRALRLAGAVGTGDRVDANDAQDALLALNQMIDGWSTDNLMIYVTNETAFPLLPGVPSYTLGPTGDFVTERPTSIQYAFTRDANNIDRQLTQMTQQDFSTIVLKNIGNTFPWAMTSDNGFPNAQITLFPYPLQGLTLFLGLVQVLDQFANLSDSVTMPPGYEEAIVFNLAECIAPEYDRTVTTYVSKRAAMALGRIRSLNIQPQYNSCEFSGVNAWNQGFAYDGFAGGGFGISNSGIGTADGELTLGPP